MTDSSLLNRDVNHNVDLDTDLNVTRVMTDASSSTNGSVEDTGTTRACLQENLLSTQPCLDEDVTRIAVVHPGTGIEIPPCKTQRADNDTEEDRTIVQPLNCPPPTQTAGHRAAYVPDTHHMTNGGATTIWKPQTERIQKINRWLRQHRLRVILLCTVALIGVLVPFVSLRAGTHLQSQSHPEDSIQPTEIRTREKKRHIDTIQRCTLYDAATWLLNGEYNKARAGYRFLLKQNPNNRSYAATLDILETREEYQ